MAAQVAALPSKALLWRVLQRSRRWLNLALLLAFATIPANFTPGSALFAPILLAGLALMVLFRPWRRLVDPSYLSMSLILAVGTVLISLWNGLDQEETRWASYPVYYLLMVPFLAGLALVRDPLRMAVLGLRAGMPVAILLSCLAFYQGNLRYGFGGNAANAAFALTAAAVLMRIRIERTPWILRSGPIWFYLSLIPVILTGTRIVLPIYAGYALYDCLRFYQNGEAAAFFRRHWKESIAALIVIFVAGALLSTPISRRVAATYEEAAAWSKDPVGKKDGISIRFVLWERALAVIGEDPLTGSGGAESMRRIKAGIPGPPKLYAHEIHSHNLFIDELRARGILGLALHIAFFGVLMRRIWQRASADLRWNAAFFLGTMVLYGSMHGLLQTERNIALIILYFGFMLSALAKPWLPFYTRAAHRLDPARRA
jgi:O-antigen ligase